MGSSELLSGNSLDHLVSEPLLKDYPLLNDLQQPQKMVGSELKEGSEARSGAMNKFSSGLPGGIHA